MAKRILTPGTYIQEQANPDLIITADQIRSVGVIGTAPNYVISTITVEHDSGVYTETITGVETADIVSLIGIYLGDRVVDPTKYSLVDNTIVWSDTAFVDTLSQYTVRIKLAKSSAYYEALEWYDVDQSFYDTLGYSYQDGGINPLGAAAKLVKDGGAARIVTIQAVDGGVTSIKDAYDLMRKENVEYIICPQLTDNTLQAYQKDHLDVMSSMEWGKERTGFIAPITLTDNISTISAQSEGMGDEVVRNIAPGGVSMYFADSDGTDHLLTVTSGYAAAWLTGRLANPAITVAKPITKEIVTPVVSVNVDYEKHEWELLAGSGTVVLRKNKAGNIIVNQGLTTDQSNANNNEISVVETKFKCRRALRDNLDDEFPGQTLDATTAPAEVETAVRKILGDIPEVLEIKQVLTSLASSGDAVNIFVEFSVLRPFNYIKLTYRVAI